ncbi:MAG: DoxX family protein [Pseudomonadota bacterium]
MTQISKATSTDYAALTLRIGLGAMFVAHGLLKLMVFTPEGTAGYFASIGLPAWFAWPTIIAEVGGGVLLIAGAFTRAVSLAMIPLLLGTIVFAHWTPGWLFSNAGGGWEYSAFLIVASVAAAFLGNGRLAVPLPASVARLNA